MSDIAEIEAAIKQLPGAQLEQLAQWLELFRQRRVVAPRVVNSGSICRSPGLPCFTRSTPDIGLTFKESET